MVRLSSLLMVLEPRSSVVLSKEIQDPLSGNLDSTLRMPDSGYWIPDSVPLELETRVARCNHQWNSGFHKHKISRTPLHGATFRLHAAAASAYMRQYR